MNHYIKLKLNLIQLGLLRYRNQKLLILSMLKNGVLKVEESFKLKWLVELSRILQDATLRGLEKY